MTIIIWLILLFNIRNDVLVKLWFKKKQFIGCCVRTPSGGQGKTQVRLSGASKFCSWAIENGSLVVRWASEISLSSSLMVSDIKNNLQDKQKQ